MEDRLRIASVVVAFMSAPLQCRVKRRSQLLLAEGLEQARYRAPRDELLAHGFVGTGGDEDDRQLVTAAGQFLLQLWPGHLRHSDVQYQAARRRDVLRRQK